MRVISPYNHTQSLPRGVQVQGSGFEVSGSVALWTRLCVLCKHKQVWDAGFAC